MNLAEEVGSMYAEPSQTILTITTEQWELENANVSKVAQLEILNVMDKESRDRLRSKVCLQHDKSALQPRPSNINANPTPSPTLHKYDKNIVLDVDSTKIDVPIPLVEFIKIPSQKAKFKEFFDLQDELKDPPVILQAMNHDKKNGGHAPFFITLMVNNLLPHNCMLDPGASTNVMALKVMNQLGLKITRPF